MKHPTLKKFLKRKNNIMTWKEVWSNTECNYYSRAKILNFSPRTLEDLIEIMDFDISSEDWEKNISVVMETSCNDIPKNILEVGCGAGAWLFPFYKMGSRVSGVDFLPYLIECAKSIMPEGRFYSADADEALFGEEKFDLILCNSVFQYFRSYEYAEKVLINMLSHLGDSGACLLTDLFCEDKKDEYKKFRIDELKISEEEWDRRYSSSGHLYLNRDRIKSLCSQNGFNAKIINNRFIGYNHSKFRFDLMIRREK